jgi:hypothetical protein
LVFLLFWTVVFSFSLSFAALLAKMCQGERGEERVFFAGPQMQQLRSLPLAWTSLALPDPFLMVADGKAVLRLRDLQQLAQFLSTTAALRQRSEQLAV